MDEIEKLRGFILTTLDYVKIGISKESLAPLLANGPVAGFRIAAKDIAQFYEDFSGLQIEELDSLLSSKGFPTITQMYNKNYRTFLSLIAKSKIKTDDQFRLLNSFVVEQDSKLASQKEREKAEQLMVNYEATKIIPYTSNKAR